MFFITILKTTKFIKYSNVFFCKRCFANITKPPNLKIEQNTIKHFENKGDILLYSYENQRKFTIINWAGLVCYLYCANLSYYSIKCLYDEEEDYWLGNEDRWFTKLGLSYAQAKYTIAAISAIIGLAALSITWTQTLKTVKYLILNKDRKHLTIVTYLPFRKNRFIKEPIVNIKCPKNRYTADKKLELSVKSRFLKFILEMKGDFRNPALFDSTLGLMK